MYTAALAGGKLEGVQFAEIHTVAVEKGNQSGTLSITEKTKTEAIAIFPTMNFEAISLLP